MRDRILTALAALVLRRPLLVTLVAMAFAIVCGGYATLTLRLNANTDDLVAADRPFMIEYRRFIQEFGDLEYIVIAVENSGDASVIESAVEALLGKLRSIPELPAVDAGVEPEDQLKLATRVMTLEELNQFAMVAGGFPAALTGESNRVIQEAKARLRTLVKQGSDLPRDEQTQLLASSLFLIQIVASALPSWTSNEELSFLKGSDRRREYFKSQTGRYYFINVQPEKDYGTLAVVEEPLRQIRAAIDEVRSQFPEVNIGLTGKPVLQADEMATSNRDMTRASILAVALCAILFMISFGSIWRPLLAVLAFACGAAWTYGFAAATLGQLNLLSIVFMLVLIGVGMDYGIHIISRYREQRSQNQNVDNALADAVLYAGRGNLTGAITSSIVFFMAILTSFQGLRELGLIAGAGLLLCVVAMTFITPALMAMVERRASRRTVLAAPEQISVGAIRKKVINRWPGWVLLGVAIVTLALIFAPGRISFEYNILELQARGLESVEWEHRILEDSAAASWFGAVVVDDQPTALKVIADARERPTIGEIGSVFDIIQPDSAERDALRQQLHVETDAPPVEEPWTLDDLEGVVGTLRLIEQGARREAPEEAQRIAKLQAELEDVIEQMKGDGTAAIAIRERIDESAQRVADSLRLVLEGDRLPLREALPEAIRSRFMSPQGRYLIMLHPRENVWEYDRMEAFISDMRAVDPDVTGAPISHFESLGDMHRSFLQMAISSIVVIAFVIWLDFRSVRMTFLALLPTLVGMLWLVETMGMLGISFNLANFFSVPILVGLSVDGAVHMLHRYEEGAPARLQFGGTRRAVIVTALTTTIGFGCIMLAHHRGLASLGQVMALGSIFCLLATIGVLPSLLAWLEPHSNRRTSA